MRDEDAQMSPLREAAIGIHELYTELVASGFKPREALSLVAKVLAEGVGTAVERSKDDD